MQIKDNARATVIHRYAMAFPGMTGTVIKRWTPPGRREWAQLDFGANLTGQRLRISLPCNCLRFN